MFLDAIAMNMECYAIFMAISMNIQRLSFSFYTSETIMGILSKVIKCMRLWQYVQLPEVKGLQPSPCHPEPTAARHLQGGYLD